MEKVEISDSIEETKPAEVNKPLALVDKSLLQGIRELPSEEAIDRIARLFSDRGVWTGKSLHIPRVESRKLGDSLQ